MALAFSVSMAEKSGAFLGGGFQYSNLENQNTTRTSGANNNTPINTSMFGNNQAAHHQLHQPHQPQRHQLVVGTL
ncbi:hypothetical protein J5D27_00400 [Helicobacter pylori]|uniref:hypothetical protein n=2 Tax=Helicobacter pylori TaxID=210 RepID=UPI001AEABABE|nr:hypothetical protein [Helicobacter pylori]QTO99183.1 hypothetical protein J5D20_00395 [Helicobacter pylori]QTP02065.1 hypothetical protein J5D27_00400 [Helicobacter pylori]